METAFQDLSALMKEAEEMVQLADMLSKKLQETKGSEEDSRELQSIVVDMGILNPITR